MAFLNSDLQIRMALALLHLLWLACIPAATLGFAARLLPKNYLEMRYRLSVLALAAMLPMFVVAWRLSDMTKVPMYNQRTMAIEINSGNLSSTNQLDIVVESNSAGVGGSEQRSIVDGRFDVSAPTTSYIQTKPRIGDHGQWAFYLTSAYFIGVMLFTLRLLNGCLVSRRLRQRATIVTETEVLRLAVKAANKVQLGTTPVIYWCERAVVPTVVGVLRPMVLVPIAFSNGLTIEQLEHVLLHEFTHLRRWDPITNFFQNVVETLFFFHPLVWWISGQVRLFRELSCDETVVASGIDPLQYASTLIDIADRTRISLAPTVSNVSSVSMRSQLRARLSRLLGRPEISSGWQTLYASATSLVVVVVIVAALLVSTLNLTVASPQTADNANSESPAPVLSDALQQHVPDRIEPTELAGIVVDASGKPLAGVSVDAWSWHPGDETLTDENGVFRFRPESDKGRHKVEVRWTKPGYSPHYVAQQPVGVKDLIVTLDTTTFIEGTITAVDGTPAAGVTVRGAQKDIQGDGVHISEVTTETIADESGKYRLYLHPDSYEVTVASSMGVIRTEPIRVFRGISLQKDVQLEEGVRFEAIVTDVNTGQPFAGLVLSNFLQKQFKGTSDAEGRIVIDGMLPGLFEFNVGAGDPIEFRGMTFHLNGPLGRWWSPDATDPWSQLEKTPGKFQRNFDHLKFDLKPGMNPVEIVVEQGVEFSGHVYDPEGKPRGGVTVAPAKTGSGNSLTGDTRYSIKTEADGSYKVVMPAGNDVKYNLMAFDGEYGKWRKWGAVARDPLQTSPGQRVTDYDFTLTRGATVRGKVLTADEAGAAPRQVRAHPADLKGNRYYDPTVEVQADGTFELGGLRPGEHFIQVSPFWLSANDALGGSSIKVEVADGETKDGIELQAAGPESFNNLSNKDQIQPVDVPATAKIISTSAGDVIFEAQDKIFSTPCFDESSMYFGACDGNFYCLDKVTGKLKWKLEGLTRVDSSPVLHEGLVFFTSFAKGKNWLHAVRVNTGKLVWMQGIDGVGNSDPMIHGGKLYIAGTKELRSLDPKNGQRFASYDNACQLPGKFSIQGNRIAALVTEDFSANDEKGFGSLVCFDEGTQAVAWKLPLEACSLGEIRCDKMNCYFGTRDGNFYAVDLITGKVIWKNDFSSIFVNQDHVWVGVDVIDNGDSIVFTCSQQSLNEAGAMICVDKATGEKRWSLINALRYSYSNGTTPDSVVTVTLDHKLMQIDRVSGELLCLGILPRLDHQRQGESYHVALDDGFVFIVDAKKQVWRFDLSKLKRL